LGCNKKAIWRALSLSFRIRHDSRGEGESFSPQNPLNLQGPCSLVLRPACLRFSRPTCLSSYWGPRTSGSYRGPRASSVFEALVASVVCSRPTCLRFSRPSLPPLRVFLFL